MMAKPLSSTGVTGGRMFWMSSSAIGMGVVLSEVTRASSCSSSFTITFTASSFSSFPAPYRPHHPPTSHIRRLQLDIVSVRCSHARKSTHSLTPISLRFRCSGDGSDGPRMCRSIGMRTRAEASLSFNGGRMSLSVRCRTWERGKSD